MASAQRWVDNQCCRCVLLCPDYKTPISGNFSDLTVLYVGICDVKCWILLTCFVYMAIYDLEIQLFHSFSVLWNCFLIFSYFQLRSVGYIASYKINFQNWQHWKCLIPRGPFNLVKYEYQSISLIVCYCVWWYCTTNLFSALQRQYLLALQAFRLCRAVSDGYHHVNTEWRKHH